MLKTCPYSGLQFTPIRRNQVFATAKYRRDYHNEIAADLRRIKAPIDKILEKNFMILSEMVKKGESKTFNKTEILEKGYNTSVFTHLDVLNGKTVMFLYHLAILNSNDQNSLTIAYPNKDARPN